MGKPNNYGIDQLSYIHIPIIFFSNLFIIFICLLISPSGLSFLIIFKTIFTIGYLTDSTILPIYIYLPISLIHGIFEIISLYLSYKLTVSHWRNYMRNTGNKKFVVFKNLLKKTFTQYLPVILVLLIIGAILEVLISNRLAIYFYIKD